MPDNESLYYVNGDFVPASQASLPVNDLAVLRGYSVFESLRTYAGQPFRLEVHLSRLRRSAELVGIPLAWSDVQLADVVHQTLERNGFAETSVRILVTGGQSRDGFNPAGVPGLIVMATPLRPLPPEYYTQGVRVATASMERFMPEAKTLNYTPGIVAMQRAKAVDEDIFEVLFVDRQDRVTEGITSNVFAFIDERLITPKDDILFGVTRQVILELAEDLYPVELSVLSLEDLYSAGEVFLTGSVKEVLPVNSIDGRKVGTGECGPLTRRLMERFIDLRTTFANAGIQ